MDGGHWQLQGSAAELYEHYLVPGITSKWAEDLVARAELRASEEVLDLACGTGVVARLAAQRVATGSVTGADLNASMLAVARASASWGAPITWVECSALDLPFASACFDVILCQLGLQFFPDRAKALREMQRVLRPKGRIALSVYSPIERTPGAYAFVRALDEALGADSSRIKRGEHSFASPSQLTELLDSAGFEISDVQTVTQSITFPSVLDYVRFQLLATPMTTLLDGKPATERDGIVSLVASKTASLSTPAMLIDEKFSFQQEAYVAVAQSACAAG